MQARRISSRWWFCLFWLGVLFSLGIAVPAQTQERVAAVEVQGNRTVETGLVLAEIYVKPGTSYDRAEVSKDVARIYRLGFFENVEVEKVSVAGGVKLIYKVQEKPPITSIIIEGSQKVSENKIREVLTVKVNQVADNKKIAQSKEKIVDLYSKDGKGTPDIQTEVRQKDGQTELVFKISEKQGETVRQVEFEGNTVFSDGKLRKMIKTKKKGFLSWLTGSGKFREDVVERDVAFITYNYLNKGYLKVRVSQPKVEYSEEKKGLVLTFYIDEGDRYRIGDIDFAGDILTTKPELLRMLDTHKGNYFSQKILEQDLTKLQEFYGNQGYAFANINPQFQFDETAKVASLTFNVDQGQRVFVERINITGNTITRDKVIRRELKVVENSLYNESLLRLSKRKLEQLGYFETIDVSTPRGSSDDRLVLNLNVKEKPTGTFSVGAGFSSAESFLFTASVSKNNFMGLGIGGSINAEISGKRQQFSLQYNDPYFFDSNWLFNVNAYRVAANFEDFRRNSFGGEIDFGRRILDFTAISLGYRIEDVKLDDFDVLVPEFFRETASGLTSSLIFSLTRDTRNNPMMTTKGYFLNGLVEYAGNGVGGDNNFLRLTGNARYYFPLWANSAIKANLRLGYIRSLDDRPVPLYERFFTGGINSLRGYEFRSVGPALTIPNGIAGEDEEFVFGGDKLLVLNVEYEFPIYEAAGFRGVVFFDAGNAYAENQNFNPLNVRTDVGAGIRWISPFGPLRFEWGFPLNKRPGDKSNVFNFTIGSFF